MIRGFTRRLQKLELRIAAANEPLPEPHLICFVNMQREVTSTLRMEFGKPKVWTHLLPEEPPSSAHAKRE